MPASRSRIVHTANLWTLAGHPTPNREWSLAHKVSEIAAAGFDAVTAPLTPGLPPLLRKHGLRYMGFLSTSNPRDFVPQITALVADGAETINAQLGDDFTPASEGFRLALALQRESKRQKIHAAIEVHRDTMTETPEKTYAIADAYHRKTGELLPLTWDHSHLAVVKHLKPFLFEEVLLQRADLIRNSRIFHLRPFNGQHAQVPVIDARGRLTPEFRIWLQFAESLLKLWLAGPKPGGEIWICPEIGPIGIHGYNLSIMQPSWTQALVCRSEIQKLWARLFARRSSEPK